MIWLIPEQIVEKKKIIELIKEKTPQKILIS